jgi:hypothetical protein
MGAALARKAQAGLDIVDVQLRDALCDSGVVKCLVRRRCYSAHV